MKLKHLLSLLTLIFLLILGGGLFGVVYSQTQVQQQGSNAVVSGTAALTVTAAPISNVSGIIREALLQCDTASTVDCYIGSQTSQVVHISPGQSLVIPIVNLQLMYAKTASATATINWLGRR